MVFKIGFWRVQSQDRSLLLYFGLIFLESFTDADGILFVLSRSISKLLVKNKIEYFRTKNKLLKSPKIYITQRKIISVYLSLPWDGN